MQVTQDPQERLLGGVFGILALSQHPVAETKHLTLKTLHQEQHRALIARQTALHHRSEIVKCRASGHGLLPEEDTHGRQGRFQTWPATVVPCADSNSGLPGGS
jgi:hypothetical protein